MLHFTERMANTAGPAKEQSHLGLHGLQILPFAATSCFTKSLTLLHSEWPKLHRVSAVLSAKGLKIAFQRAVSSGFSWFANPAFCCSKLFHKIFNPISLFNRVLAVLSAKGLRIAFQSKASKTWSLSFIKIKTIHI